MLNTQTQSLSRDDEIVSFLDESGFGHLTRQPLQADASFRRYERLTGDKNSLMLMDAPPPKEDVRPFIAVTDLLRQYGFSAPEILAQDQERGFLVLEDLGRDSYSSLLRADPSREKELYLAATELQAQLYHQAKHVAAPLAPYDYSVLMREIALLSDWFLPQIVGIDQAHALKPSYLAAWESVFKAAPLELSVPVLRDYHADNLMWLPERTGIQRVGLLDYQDALLGDSAYDLVSFLEDIRRTVSPDVIAACLDHFIKQTGQNRDDFMVRYAVLGAQRNTKIVGIFTRLCVRDGKPHYLGFLPQVWAWLVHDVSHPVLAPVKQWLDAHVPPEYRDVITANSAIGSLA